MPNKVSEILGWYGVIAILTAYALNNFSVITNSSITYQFLNLSGATGIVIDAFKQRNYQPVVLNIIWGTIALIAIINTVI